MPWSMKFVPNGDFSEKEENFQKPLRSTEESCAQYVAVDSGSKLAKLIYFLTVLIQSKNRLLASNQQWLTSVTLRATEVRCQL